VGAETLGVAAKAAFDGAAGMAGGEIGHVHRRLEQDLPTGIEDAGDRRESGRLLKGRFDVFGHHALPFWERPPRASIAWPA
jgi:hypothetical protein